MFWSPGVSMHAQQTDLGSAATQQPENVGETNKSPEVAPADEQRQTTRPQTVLIVENEENNRRLVEQILAYAGYPCVAVTNGVEALSVLRQSRVDIVLIDLSMPVLDGYRTTALIRQIPGCSDLPIVAVTAHAMTEDRELALAAGCTEYLAKPFRPNELLGIVERMLRSQGHRG